MKILLIVGHNGIYSGASYQALYLGMGLKDRGHEVHCIWGPEGGDPTLHAVTEAGLTLYTLSMRGKFNLRAIRTLRRILKLERFEVVHCSKGMAMYRALWASWGLKIPALIFNREVSKPLEFFQGSKYRSPKVDRLVADSEAVRQILIRTGRVKPEKIAVVYDEVDLQRYHPAVDGAKVRAEYGVTGSELFCGLIGNYAPWRGQEYFLQAIAQLKSVYPEFHRLKFLLVGKETDSLKPRVQELGLESCVQFTGFRQDLERVVAALDVVVNCSYAVESLPGSITIAMAMGKPVIATAIAGSPELVEEGLTGFLAPLQDASALAQALQKLVDLPANERQLMGRRARAKMETGFSRTVRAARMEALYREILDEKIHTA